MGRSVSSNLGSATHVLCELKQVTGPLWASISLPVGGEYNKEDPAPQEHREAWTRTLPIALLSATSGSMWRQVCLSQLRQAWREERPAMLPGPLYCPGRPPGERRSPNGH